METAKINGVNPYAYLKSTLEAIANGHPASDIDQLLPWAFTPASSRTPGGVVAPLTLGISPIKNYFENASITASFAIR